MPVSVLSYSNKELNYIINTEKMNQKDASINNDEQEDDINKNENTNNGNEKIVKEALLEVY